MFFGGETNIQIFENRPASDGYFPLDPVILRDPTIRIDLGDSFNGF